MKIQITEKMPQAFEKVAFVFEGAALPAGIDKKEFKGERLKTHLRHEGGRRLYIGLGNKKTVQENTLRQAAGVAIRQLLSIGGSRASFDLSKFPQYAQAVVEGALMGAYKFEHFVSPEKKRKTVLKALSIVADKGALAEVRKAANIGKITAEASNYTREVGNLPGNVMTPAELASRARKMAKTEKIRCKVWDRPALKKDGFGGILAVGQGSANDPRLILLEHKASRKKAPTIVLVGKAITFDSGGISIKPGAQMDEMKFDKMGGCAVLGIMQAVSRLKLPIHVIGLIASAENMPSSTAYRPGDIVTTYDGKTVEVLNTDAEGRIVMADALAYGRKHCKPDFMIDLATLTGACVVALGSQRAGLFSENDQMVDALRDAGETTGERVWPLPVGDEYDRMIMSEIATAKNLGGRWAGASSAASFLKVWAEDVPWAHIDIAGTAWSTERLPHLEKGATGFGVRLVTSFLQQYK